MELDVAAVYCVSEDSREVAAVPQADQVAKPGHAIERDGGDSQGGGAGCQRGAVAWAPSTDRPPLTVRGLRDTIFRHRSGQF